MNNPETFNSLEHAVRVLEKSGCVIRFNGRSWLLKSKYYEIRNGDSIAKKAVRLLDSRGAFNPIDEMSLGEFAWSIKFK